MDKNKDRYVDVSQPVSRPGTSEVSKKDGSVRSVVKKILKPSGEDSESSDKENFYIVCMEPAVASFVASKRNEFLSLV